MGAAARPRRGFRSLIRAILLASLRVLYLNPFSQEVSGPDESLRTLLGVLIPMGVEAHLVLPKSGPQVPRYEALGVKVHYAPLTILSRRLSVGAALMPFRLLRGVAAISRLVRRERIDLIHTNMEVVLDGAVASRLLRVPHILHYRGNTNDDPKAVFDVLTRFWTGTAEKVFCISNATSEIFRKRGLGMKIETLYNGVDTEAFERAERSDAVRMELGAGPGDLLVGMIGRIHPRKDVETFVRAAALVAQERPHVRFVVVGMAEAPEEHAYELRLRALGADLGLGDRLRWAGARRDIPRVMKALDVFTICSRKEGFGRVVAEAMTASVPAVLTRDGAFPELVTDSVDGLLADPGSADSFSRRIQALVDDPQLALRIGARAHETCRRFRASRVATAVLAAYEGASRPRSPHEQGGRTHP